MTVMTLVECGRQDISESSLAANIEHGKIQRTFNFGVGAAKLGQSANPNTIFNLGIGAGSIPTNGVFTAPQPQDLIDTIYAIIGNTAYGVSSNPGRLTRTLPMSDPQIPYWYAASIDRMKGVGTGTFQLAPTLISPSATAAPPVEGGVGTPIAPPFVNIIGSQPAGFLIYPTYEITITFSPVQYAVFTDANIVVNNKALWYPPAYLSPVPTQMQPAYTPLRFAIAPEWQRFCYYDEEAVNDYIVSNTGQMVFREQTGVGSLNSVPFSGPPRMYLPNSIITFKWYGVPLRYVTSPNSFIRGFRGLVNQFAFWDTPTVSGNTAPAASKVFQAGSLLYLTYKISPFLPPIAQAAPLIPLIATNALPARLVNLEFQCLYTNRKPATNLAVTPVNPNWIPAGHNLLPSFLDRGFHYATSVSSPALQFANTSLASTLPFVLDQAYPWLWMPSFQSFPIEMLWLDPDAQTSIISNIQVSNLPPGQLVK